MKSTNGGGGSKIRFVDPTATTACDTTTTSAAISTSATSATPTSSPKSSNKLRRAGQELSAPQNVFDLLMTDDESDSSSGVDSDNDVNNNRGGPKVSSSTPFYYNARVGDRLGPSGNGQQQKKDSSNSGNVTPSCGTSSTEAMATNDEEPLEIEDFSCKNNFEKVTALVESALKERQQKQQQQQQVSPILSTTAHQHLEVNGSKPDEQQSATATATSAQQQRKTNQQREHSATPARVEGLQVLQSDKGLQWVLTLPSAWCDSANVWHRHVDGPFPEVTILASEMSKKHSTTTSVTVPTTMIGKDIVLLPNPLSSTPIPSTTTSPQQQQHSNCWALQFADIQHGVRPEASEGGNSNIGSASSPVSRGLLSSLTWSFPLLLACAAPPQQQQAAATTEDIHMTAASPQALSSNVMIVRPLEFEMHHESGDQWSFDIPSIAEGSEPHILATSSSSSRRRLTSLLHRKDHPQGGGNDNDADESVLPFQPALALSIAMCGNEAVRAECTKTKKVQSVTAAASVPSQNATPSNEQFIPALPISFVPVSLRAQGHNIHKRNTGHTNNNEGGSLIWSGAGVSTFPSPALLSKGGGAGHLLSARMRCCAEWTDVCPPQCRLLGDVVELFHHMVGLKSRLFPFHMVQPQPHIDVDDYKSNQNAQPIPLTSLPTTSTWACMEHLYSLSPSMRRCDWEDRMELMRIASIERVSSTVQQQSAATQSQRPAQVPSASNAKRFTSGGGASSPTSPTTLSSAHYATGLSWGTSINPVERVLLAVTWPWIDAAYAKDTTLQSVFDVTTPSTGRGTTSQASDVSGGAHPSSSASRSTTRSAAHSPFPVPQSAGSSSGAGSAAGNGAGGMTGRTPSLPPTVVLAQARRKNRFEFSYKAADTLSEVAYALAYHADRISDDATAEEAAAVYAQQSQHRRMTPVELAALAAAVFGEEGKPLPPIIHSRNRDDDDASSEFMGVPPFAEHAPHLSMIAEMMPAVQNSARFFSSTRHLFNRFARACTMLEDPDDMHALWIALIDKLRTRIDFDVDGNGDWRYFIDPGVVHPSQHKDQQRDAAARGGVQDIVPSAPLLVMPTILPKSSSSSSSATGPLGEYVRHQSTIALDAPLVLQKLQLLWSTGELQQHHEEGVGEEEEGKGESDTNAKKETGATKYGWDDDDDELLYDCDDNDNRATTPPSKVAASPHRSPARPPTSLQQNAEVSPTQQDREEAERYAKPPLLLLASGRSLMIPPPVPLPLATIDQLETQQRDLLRLGQSGGGESTRRWMLSQQLMAEMSLFLHMNGNDTRVRSAGKHRHGDVCFADFVQWHSPADFIASPSSVDSDLLEAAKAAFLRGDAGADEAFSDLFLSSRMRSPSSSATSSNTTDAGAFHLWWTLWNKAEPLSYSTLKRQAYALHESVAVTLDWLENQYTLEELLRDVWVANVMNAVVPMVHQVREGSRGKDEVSGSGGQESTMAATDGAKHMPNDVAQLLQQLHRLCRRLHAPGHEAAEVLLGGDDVDNDDDDEYVRMSKPSSSTTTAPHQQHTLRTWTMQQAREQRAVVKSIIAIVEQIECEASVALALSDMLTTKGQQQSAGAGTVSDLRRFELHCPVTIPRGFWKHDVSHMLQKTRQSSNKNYDEPTTTQQLESVVLPSLSLLQSQCHVVCAAQRPVEEGTATCPPLLQALHCSWDWRQKRASSALGNSDRTSGGGAKQRVAREDGSGVSALPEVRAAEGWGTATGLPILCVRSALSEELL